MSLNLHRDYLNYFLPDCAGGRRDATKRVPQTRSGEDCLSDWRSDGQAPHEKMENSGEIQIQDAKHP